jgi:bifunctional oligoribonuclease and PAP phosphatase NrnA
MAKADLRSVLNTMTQAESVLISSHVSPDGDSIGSMLALYHLLRALDCRRVDCVSPDPVPGIYAWLPGAEAILDCPSARPPYQVAVILDALRRERIGAASDLIGVDTTVIVIDHHHDDRVDGDLCFVDKSYGAVGEIVVRLFELAHIPITREVAECAYVAIATDTGSFRYSLTTPNSHRVAAQLLETGICVPQIASRVFESMSYAKCRLLARILDSIELYENQRVAVGHISPKDLDAAGAHPEDLDGLINFARNVEGVEVAVLFRELDGNTTKVSLRSRPGFDCASVTQQFGGGGHPGAAGATLALPFPQARDLILKTIRLLMEVPE